MKPPNISQQQHSNMLTTTQNALATAKQHWQPPKTLQHQGGELCTCRQKALTFSENVKFEFSYTVILHFDPLFQHIPTPFVLSLCSVAFVQRQNCIIFHLISSAKLYVVIGLLHSATKCHERRIQSVLCAFIFNDDGLCR